MGRVGPIHHIHPPPLLSRQARRALLARGNAQRQWTVARVQVGQLADQYAVIVEDLRAPELGTGQAHCVWGQWQAQLCANRTQLRDMSSAIGA